MMGDVLYCPSTSLKYLHLIFALIWICKVCIVIIVANQSEFASQIIIIYEGEPAKYLPTPQPRAPDPPTGQQQRQKTV